MLGEAGELFPQIIQVMANAGKMPPWQQELCAGRGFGREGARKVHKGINATISSEWGLVLVRACTRRGMAGGGEPC